MNFDKITVWYKGNALLIHREVADGLGLSPGQTLATETEFWRVLRVNATMTIAKCEIQIEKDKAGETR